MSWIIAQLTSKIAGPIGAGLSVILAISLAAVILTKNATIAETHRQLASITAERDQAKADLNQCRENRITLEEATRRQNAAVEAAKAEGDARVAALTKAADQAKASAAAANGRAAAILNRAGSTCADADAIILENVR